MSEPKCTCANCNSENEPYFSRVEPMGFYCPDCGYNFYEKYCATESVLEDLRLQLHDAKISADLWMKHAKQADESAADLKAALADTKKHWKRETEEQARLLGMSGERECDLLGKISRLERELAIAQDRIDFLILQIETLNPQ